MARHRLLWLVEAFADATDPGQRVLDAGAGSGVRAEILQYYAARTASTQGLKFSLGGPNLAVPHRLAGLPAIR